MHEPGETEDAATILSSLEEARAERVRLAGLGRWSEADETALRALRDALSAASPKIVGPDLAGLVYVAGSPRPGYQVRSRRVAVPPARLAATSAMSLVNRGRERSAAVEAAQRALASFAWEDLGTFWYAVLALVYSEELDAAKEHLHRALKLSGWGASHPHRSAMTVLQARIAGLSGEPVRAVHLLENALRRGVFVQFAEVAVAWAVQASVDLGELDRAENLLFAHGFGHGLDEVTDKAEVLAARGALREASGRPQSAYEDFTESGRVLAEWGVTNPAVICWRSRAALSAAATDRRSLAHSLADEELVQARRWGTSAAIGSARRAVALVSGEDRDIEEFEKAIDQLEQSRARGTLMRARYELGIRLTLRGRTQEGRSALTAARDTALSLGSDVWVTRVDEAMRRWATDGNVVILTSREARVLNLAQAGLGNREVAERLRLTNSTVEFHLSNIYRKLGISGRSDLSSILVPVFDGEPRKPGTEDPTATR
ncbi:LuxR C-terminal-related transcriptional regulator [Amycolatopsis thailandensis]|uniref:LuxR C-terminal-related transcriptional regulator n=1 Tax=Amycolatopsis thailandensis TaxID=589330 RepID=UPI00362765F8